MRRLLPVIAIIIFSAVAVPGAEAALGEPERSVVSDQRTLGGVKRTKKVMKNYSVQEIVSDATCVREYITSSGIVFAVGWNGLTHPDLTPLLGRYVDEYRKALRRSPATPGRRALQVKGDRVVVEKWGHMRNLQGRAYVPSLLPPGVNAHEIR